MSLPSSPREKQSPFLSDAPPDGRSVRSWQGLSCPKPSPRARGAALPAGLTQAEARGRLLSGGRNVGPTTSRGYGTIVRENCFTFVNNVVLSLCGALLVLGEFSDAVIAAGVVLGNIAVSLFQEIRTKVALDRIALLARANVDVVRDDTLISVPPEEVVSGDVVRVARGDQIVADGTLLQSAELEVDEALLTGESHPLPRRKGDRLLSGTFAVAGSGFYRAESVGAESTAGKMASRARHFRSPLTPLQRQVNLIVRIVLLVAVIFELILLMDALVSGLSVAQTVKMSVVIAKLVPAGLFLSITLSYAVGAVRVAGRNVLVRAVNAVESLSHVDTVCMDKTGTLTANRERLSRLMPIGLDEPRARQMLAVLAGTMTAGSSALEAIGEAMGRVTVTSTDEVAFSSERGWSALVTREGPTPGTMVLASPDALPRPVRNEYPPEVTEWAEAHALRMLVVASSTCLAPLGVAGAPVLPRDLHLVAVIGLDDPVRPDARAVVDALQTDGVSLRIVSGDGLDTVRAVARRSGIDGPLDGVTGSELAEMDEGARRQAIRSKTIFARISPPQKEEIVRCLRRDGRYVAMVGDGVNDLLALKAASLAVAMGSGSPAARSVADMVLLDDAFGAVPTALGEGRRIRSALRDILEIFLTRVLAVAILLMGVMTLGGFPFDPKSISILTTLTVGIPSIGIALWARPGIRPSPREGAEISGFVVPAGVSIGLGGLGLYAFLALTSSPTVAESETAMTLMTVLCGLILLVSLEPPWHVNDRPCAIEGDWRPAGLSAVMLAVLAAVMLAPPLRTFLGLAILDRGEYVAIGVAGLLWTAVFHIIWRGRVYERFLGTHTDMP